MLADRWLLGVSTVNMHAGKEVFGAEDVVGAGPAALARPAVPGGAVVPGSCGTLVPFLP
jgi:hypothetical protein